MSLRLWALAVALALALPLALGATQPARAEVAVVFVAPERFTDAQNRFGTGLPLRVTLAEIRRLFTALGDRLLRPDQSLAIEVLDIDLAGIDAPGIAAPYGPRVVTDITPPRFRLRYALRENGRIVLRGEEIVTDLNYLLHYAQRSSSVTLYYEREIIRDWLQNRIVARLPPHR